MDRSSLNRVETTNDVEKRQAFKAKLAQKIDKEPSAVIKEEPFHGFQIGKKVWHPELGAGTVTSVDITKNEIILDSLQHGEVSLVFSLVKGKLRPMDDTVEHVPFKPLKKEISVPVLKTTYRDLSVVLPPIFETWSLATKYHYLTNNQHLTTEEANDVFAVLDGKTPRFHKVGVIWREPDKIEPAKPVQKAEPEPVVHPFASKRVWHPDFGECFVTSIDEKNNEIILQSKVGHVPFILSVTLPKLVMLEDGQTIEHAPKQLGSKTPIAKETIVESKSFTIELPKVFSTWKPLEQLQFLQTNQKLGSEDAKDVIAILEGRAIRNQIDKFEIVWVDEVTASTTQTFKEDKLYKAPPQAYSDAPTVEPVIRTGSNLTVNLPSDFRSWRVAQQHGYLTAKKLTPEETEDVIAIVNGKPQTSQTNEYTINIDGAI